MAVLSMESLPLGFRFRPTDEELINHYLRLKINGRDSEVQVIPEIDICKWEPWDLPGLSVIKTEDPEWFFFCPRDRKYPNGARSNRATDAGYWKATGKDRTIKLRKSGTSPRMIGMKKTLVFYRGRAPKGERTHWVMHEYRPTEKDMDGTGPGQCAFVLFRLFRKSDEKVDVIKYDEIEPTGSYPTTIKSSPDDTSSDLIQETPMLDMQVEEKQSEGIKRWLKNKSDNMTSNALITVESSSNSDMASDVENQAMEETATKAYSLDCKVFSPLQAQFQSELPPYMDSPFVGDFGNDPNGFHFLDGTSEQDISLTELLDEVFNNNDELSGEEITSKKNLNVGSETQLSGYNSMFQPRPLAEYSPATGNGSYSDKDVDIVQLQHNQEMGASRWFNEQIDSKDSMQMPNSFGSYQDQVLFHGQELERGNVGAFGDNSIGQNALSADSGMGSFYGMFNNMEESASWNDPINYSGNLSGAETGIKIRSRQIQDRPSSDDFVAQGFAPRRIRLQRRLQMSLTPGDMGNSEVGESGCIEPEEGEAQSAVTEVSTSQNNNNNNNGGDFVEGTGIKIRTRQAHKLPSSDNFVTQGTAPRRIRLQMGLSSGSVGNEKVGDSDCTGKEDEAQSTQSDASDSLNNPANDKFGGGTGIKIRTRQPQNQPSSDNCVSQGIAPRRIRLQVKHPPESDGNGKVGNASPSKEDDEAQSTVTEVIKGAETSTAIDEPETESELPNFDKSQEIPEEPNTKLRQRVKREGLEIESSKISEAAASARSSSSSSLVYTVSVCLVIIMVVMFIKNVLDFDILGNMIGL